MSDGPLDSPLPRPRDAAKTRQRLLGAARVRFAMDGYDATTVRDIADDVRVNVALINRYFGSKQGLFEACVEAAVRELAGSAERVQGLPEVVDVITRAAVRASSLGGISKGGTNDVLLLLLRSSRDESAEEKRLSILRDFGTGLAAAAGWDPGKPGADELLLRAQLVLAVAAGIVMLRASSGLEPLGSATEERLTGPLHDIVAAMLGARAS